MAVNGKHRDMEMNKIISMRCPFLSANVEFKGARAATPETKRPAYRPLQRSVGRRLFSYVM